MATKILCVDDDVNILAGFQRNLRRKYELEFAGGGKEALDLLAKHGPFAVVVADMQMPEMNGIELLKNIARQSPDTVRVMLTGNADQRPAVEAVNDGHVFRFLTKPCPPETLDWALEASLQLLNHDGVMLVTAGTKITATLLERLHNFAELSGVKEPIYVEG